MSAEEILANKVHGKTLTRMGHADDNN